MGVLSLGKIMLVLSIAYIIVKVMQIVIAASLYDTLGDCVTTSAATQRLVLREICRSCSVLGIVSASLAFMIVVYYAAPSHRKKRMLDGELKPTYWQIVAKPGLVVLMGTLVVALDLLCVGALTLARPRDLAVDVNASLDDDDTCVNTGNVGALRDRAWASVVIFVTILLLGHHMGVMRKFVHLRRRWCKQRRESEDRDHHEEVHPNLEHEHEEHPSDHHYHHAGHANRSRSARGYSEASEDCSDYTDSEASSDGERSSHRRHKGDCGY